jgi:uncharacterized protein (TIGR03067 family)
MRFTLALAAAAALPVALAAGDKAGKSDREAMAGSWKVVGGESNGQPFPESQAPAISFTLKPDGTATGTTPDGMFTARMKLDEGKKPKTMDIAYDTGPFQGMSQYGLYKLDGDRLTVAVTPPGAREADRPREFRSQEGKCVVFIFERVRAGKKP